VEVADHQRVRKGKQDITWHDPPAWVDVMRGIRLAPLSFFGTGDGSGPEIVIVDYAPHIEVPIHYHRTDYCSIVVAGTVRVNRTWHAAGAVRIVKAETAYALRSGPEGCRVIEVFADAALGDAIPVAADASEDFERTQRAVEEAVAALDGPSDRRPTHT
jgi:hypothetical protein